MNVEKRIFVSSDAIIENKGTGVPAWFGDESNKSKWFTSTNARNDWFYMIDGDRIYLQYGQNTSLWAGCRHLVYDVTLLEETVNSDNSLSVRLTMNLVKYSKHNTDYAMGGVRVIEEIILGSKLLFINDGMTTDEFVITTFNNNPQTVTVTVAPQGVNNTPAIRVNNSYPNGEYQDNFSQVGYQLYNPLQPTYTPAGYKDPNNGQWKSCNRNGKNNLKKVGSTWETIAKENFSTAGQANQGHVRVRKLNATTWNQARNEDDFLN